MLRKSNDYLSLLLLAAALVMVAAAIFFSSTDTLEKQDEDDAVTKILEEQRTKDQETIKKLLIKQRDLIREIDTLEKIKKALGNEYEKLQNKLQSFNQVRYYPDADFISESNRIARSRYRHDTPDNDTAQE